MRTDPQTRIVLKFERHPGAVRRLMAYPRRESLDDAHENNDMHEKDDTNNSKPQSHY